jgi:hypothetical protein
MPWFQVDDGFPGHPKVAGIRRGPTRERAAGLWVLAGAWSSKYLTEGAIPRHQVEELGCTKASAQSLVEAGLWHANGHDCDECPQPPPGGYQFHNWTQSNMSKEQALDRKSKRQAAGAKGGKASGESRRGGSKDEASASANGEASASPSVEPLGANPSPVQSSPVQSQPPNPSLIDLVRRRLSRNGRDLATTTDDLIPLWQDAVGDADLETELRSWLIRNADTDLDNPGAALLGWLRKAASHAADQPERPSPAGCGDCDTGWLADDLDTGLPVPCPACKPHLQPVPEAS